MTKTFSALAVVLAGLGAAASAQPVPIFADAQVTPSDDRPVSVFTQSADSTAVPSPIWRYERGQPAPLVAPEVMERSINIAIREGVLGFEIRRYRVAFPRPGYVGVIPAPVPAGWIVIRRCMERDVPTDAYPDGECLVFEMRELLGDPHSVAWD